MHKADNLSYYIISLGCSKNQTDSERLSSDLSNAGLTQAEAPDESDIVFVNTCGFIESAKEESISVILETLDLKKSYQGLLDRRVVVVFGCLTKRYFEEIQGGIPETDLVFGLYDNSFLTRLFENLQIEPVHRKVHATRKPLASDLGYEYIKIAEGCSNNCSYCAIPLIRGPSTPYDPQNIMKDAAEAAERGAKELIIIAQDSASYRFGDMRLIKLVDEISKINGPEWIRILYIHPDHITDEMIDAFASIPKLVHYFDIPFQHVSQRILKNMNRSGSYDRYISLVNKIRSRMPDAVIRSTFMVGFPEETEEEFEELLRFLKESRLDRVGAFEYSPEENTPAALLPDIKKRVKNSRFKRLMSLQQGISADKMKEKVGNVFQVLVEEKIDDETWSGRTMYDAPEVDGVFYLTSKKKELKLNEFVQATATDSTEYDLIGTI